MALGQYQVNVSVDTATDPDDTEIIPAPGAGQRIHIFWFAVVVTDGTAGSEILLEDGVGGDPLFQVDASSGSSGVEHEEFLVHPLRLSENTALNATNKNGTGASANVIVSYEVRGR